MVVAFITEWKQSWYRVSRLFAGGALAAVAFSLTHLLAARSFLESVGEPVKRSTVMGAMVSVFRSQAHRLSTLLPSVSWFFVLAFGLGFAVLTLFTVLRSIDNRRSWMLFAVKLVLTLMSLVIIFNLPVSVWGFALARGIILLCASMIAGAAIGVLAASWRAQALMADPLNDMDDSDRFDEEPVLQRADEKRAVYDCLRVTGVYAAPVLMLLVLAGAVINLLSMRHDDGSFMDKAAERLVDGLGERRWIVTNGLMDQHILIAAGQRDKDVVLLAPYRVRNHRYIRYLRNTIRKDPDFSDRERDWALKLLSYNLHMFINDFFVSADNICGRAVCMGLPDIWYESGRVPVAELLFYGGADSADKIDARALLASHRAYFEAEGAELCDTTGEPRLSGLTRRYRNALERHLSFVANNLGVVLDELEMPTDAFEVYGRALELNEGNISALLNRFELVSRGLYPEKRDLVEKQVSRMVRETEDSYPLWAMNRYFGYVRNYELFVNMGWEWAVSSSPGSVIAGLRRTYTLEENRERRYNLTAVMAAVYEMKGDTRASRDYYKELIAADPRNALAISGLVRLSLRDGGLEEARLILEQGQQSGVSARTLRKDWAALYLMAGDLSRARTTLQAMADESGADPMTVAMLAMVMIEQGEYAAVESKILPRLAKMEDAADNYFVHVIQGRIYQMKGSKWFAEARKRFQRAFIIRPDVVALREVIFRLDVALGDRQAAEAHAIEILRADPKHPLANFFMGSVALEEGEYGQAEEYLKRAAAAPEPTVEALNNYAQLLCRIRRTDEAVKVARRSAQLAPERYEVWSTLAYILQDSGDLQEASRALVRASGLNKSDKRLFIIDGLIALKKGDMVSVKRAVDAIESEEADLPVTDRRDLQKLKDALSESR